MSQDFSNSPMSTSPETRRPVRAPRVVLRGSVPAVIQLENRRQFAAKLHTLSITGGLLETSSYVDERSKVSLAFFMSNGQLMAKAEMLFPMPSGAGYKQPFRFTGFGPGVRQALEREIAAYHRETVVPQRPAASAAAPSVAADTSSPLPQSVQAKPGHGSGLQLPRFFLEVL